MPPRPVDPHVYRRVVGRFATGVTVVTTVADGVAHALTVNSFASVSLDPVLVLFCVERDTRLHDPVLASGRWAVSVLAADAEDAARWFASSDRPVDGQLAGFAHTPGPVTGAPVLDDALTSLECRTWAAYDGGDHTIIVGEVCGLGAVADAGTALLYLDGGYRQLDLTAVR
jgi:flavin reductase (DIM6/NTAB) family NADH-FMN oxidoreductase RutF